MPLRRRKMIGQVDPRARKLKQLRRQEQARRLETAEAGQQLPPQSGQQPDADSASAPRPPADPLGGWDGEWGGGRDSFADTLSQSLQVLGSRTADDEAGVGATADAALPGAYPAGSPGVPDPAADPAGLRKLQRAMGATDEEMAILQQLGGAAPVWTPVKIEVTPGTSLCAPKREEEEEEEEDFTDLDRQWTAPEPPPAEVSRRSGEGAAVAAAGGAAAGGGKRRWMPPPPDGRCADDLLAGFEEKEMVCPACRHLFLGYSALQRHVSAAHAGRVSPSPHRSEHLALHIPSEVSMMVDPPKLVCPLCREVVAGRDAQAARDALAVHVAEEHPSSAAEVDLDAATPPPSCSDESVGLKTQISTALGGLLDRALGGRQEEELAGPGRRQTGSLLPKPAAACATPSPSRRSRRLFNTELASEVLRQMNVRAPYTDLVRARVFRNLTHYPFVCFYCECRFEHQTARHSHMLWEHRAEIEAELLAAGGSGGGGGGDWQREAAPQSAADSEPAPRPTADSEPAADSEPERWQFLPAKRGRPPGRGRGGGDRFRWFVPVDESIRRKAEEALREMGEVLDSCEGRWRCQRAARRRHRQRARPAAPKVRTGAAPPPQREIEVVFVNEVAAFPAECEPADAARDPLSIEEEAGALSDAEFAFCDVESIKREVLEDPLTVSEYSGCVKVDPGVDSQVEETDNKVYSNI